MLELYVYKNISILTLYDRLCPCRYVHAYIQYRTKVLAQPGFSHKDRRKSLKNAILCLICFAKLALKFKYTANRDF